MAKQITLHFQDPDQDQPERTWLFMPGNQFQQASDRIWTLDAVQYQKMHVYANTANWRWQHQNGNHDRPIFWLRTLFIAEYQRYIDRWAGLNG
jgi:hypothetical protein